MVFWEMQFFHLNHSGLNVKWETVVFFNSNSSVKRLNRGNSRIIGDFGLSWRYFGSKPMKIFWPTAPRGTWAGWQTWRRCIRSWRKNRGRWHTEQARTRPAWSPTSTCSHGSPTPEGEEPKLGVKNQRKTSYIHRMDIMLEQKCNQVGLGEKKLIFQSTVIPNPRFILYFMPIFSGCVKTCPWCYILLNAFNCMV